MSISLNIADSKHGIDPGLSSTISVARPDNIGSVGVWLVVIHHRDNRRDISTVPSGFTQRAMLTNVDSVLHGEIYVYTKPIDGSEAATVDFSFDNTTNWSYSSYRVTGDIDESNPVNNVDYFQISDTDIGDVIMPSINSSNGNKLLVFDGISEGDSALSVTSTDGMNDISDPAAYDSGSAGSGLFAFDEDIAADGATGTRTIQYNIQENHVAVIMDLNAVTGVTLSGITKADGVTLVDDGTYVQHLYADDNKGTNETPLEVNQTIGGGVTFSEELPVGKVRFIRVAYQEGGNDIVKEQFFTD